MLLTGENQQQVMKCMQHSGYSVVDGQVPSSFIAELYVSVYRGSSLWVCNGILHNVKLGIITIRFLDTKPKYT